MRGLFWRFVPKSLPKPTRHILHFRTMYDASPSWHNPSHRPTTPKPCAVAVFYGQPARLGMIRLVRSKHFDSSCEWLNKQLHVLRC